MTPFTTLVLLERDRAQEMRRQAELEAHLKDRGTPSRIRISIARVLRGWATRLDSKPSGTATPA